jgi:DNA-binding SARP family transcriptional activator
MPKSFRVLQAELLPDWPDPWLESAREPLNALRLRRSEDWARSLLSTGHCGRALEAARVAAGIDPLRESAQRLIVECHLAEGNRADAIRQFRGYEADLWRELRVRPGNDLRVLVGLEPERATGRASIKDDVRV